MKKIICLIGLLTILYTTSTFSQNKNFEIEFSISADDAENLRDVIVRIIKNDKELKYNHDLEKSDGSWKNFGYSLDNYISLPGTVIVKPLNKNKIQAYRADFKAIFWISDNIDSLYLKLYEDDEATIYVGGNFVNDKFIGKLISYKESTKPTNDELKETNKMINKIINFYQNILFKAR